jgi:ribonuclease P protein subunit RPR2
MAIKKSGIVKKIANERIEILYQLAKESYSTDPELSRSYVKLIKEISSHYKITLDKSIKNNICRKCDTVLIPGQSSTVRTVSSKRFMSYKCNNCGEELHIHY